MKPQQSLICLAIIAVFLTACKKDYRTDWIGTYDLFVCDYHEYGNPWEPPLEIEMDTIHFIGTIEKYGKERLKITFRPNTSEPFPIKGIIYPVLYDVGTLTYPEYMQYLFSVDRHGDFTGFFTGIENRIIIRYTDQILHGPLGYVSNWKHVIDGTKINK